MADAHAFVGCCTCLDNHAWQYPSRPCLTALQPLHGLLQLEPEDLLGLSRCGMQALRARFQLPFGAILHPLAEPQNVPVLNMCQSGIMRCNRCRTYVNPFNEWVDGGRWGLDCIPA